MAKKMLVESMQKADHTARLDDRCCLRRSRAGRVMVLGIVQDASPPTRSADALIDLARMFDLDLVHWCRCARASWDSPLFRHLLAGTGS